MICALCGGTGGARLARGISYVCDPAALTYICNIGDNIRLFGLTICPDIDTVIYYLSGSADYGRGWGLHAESFDFLERLHLFYPDAWFGLGDKDLATHVWRSELLRNGWCLSEITTLEARLCGVQSRVIPATDTWVETQIETASHATLHYEEYFIRLNCEPHVSQVRYEGIEGTRPAPGVLEAIASSSTVIIAPSNPVASILPEFPHSPGSVGQLYRDFCSHFVLDERDFAYTPYLEEMGYDVHLLKTDALTLERQVELARDLQQLTENLNSVGIGARSGEHTIRG